MNKCKVILKNHFNNETYKNSYSLTLVLNNGIEITNFITNNEVLLILLTLNLSKIDNNYTFEVPFKIKKGSYSNCEYSDNPDNYWIYIQLIINDDFKFTWFLSREIRELVNNYINDFEVEIDTKIVNKSVLLKDGVLTDID